MLAVLVVQQAEQALGDPGGEFLEQRGAVVGRQARQDLPDFFLRHVFQQQVLEGQFEQGKHLVGQMAGQQAEQQDAVLVLEGGEQLGDFRRRLHGQELAEVVEASGFDEIEDVGQQQVAENHALTDTKEKHAARPGRKQGRSWRRTRSGAAIRERGLTASCGAS